MSSTRGDSSDRSTAHRRELDRAFALGRRAIRGAAALATVAVVFGPGSVAAAPAADGSTNRFDAALSAAREAVIAVTGDSTVSPRTGPETMASDSASTSAPSTSGATDARSTPAIAARTTEAADAAGFRDSAGSAGAVASANSAGSADAAGSAGPAESAGAAESADAAGSADPNDVAVAADPTRSADGARPADATPSAKAVGLDAEVVAIDAAERVDEPLGDGDDVPLPLERPVVVLYGDSLAWEARHAFTSALAGHPGVRVVVRTLGGTAICDWFDAMAQDAVTLAPGMVVIEFIGNSFTPCMHDDTGRSLSGAAVVDRYARDVERAIALFAPIGTQVVLAGAPVSLVEAGGVGAGGGGMNQLYGRTAREHPGVRYADAGASVLADGRWTNTLPCLPGEPCTGGVDETGIGVNVVRASDGQHFCPASADAARGVTGDCPVWASGAFRYGTALAQPVADSLAVV